jgi:FemAB-related protein (PEP-CTERM system-associated)
MSSTSPLSRPPDPGAGPEDPGRVTVRELGAADVGRWDDFVEACPQATFFHLSGWGECVRQALGHRVWHLYAEGPHGIEGVLPLGQVKSALFGNALISAPFSVYGGIAASTEAAAGALHAEAVALAERLGVDYLELRQRESRTGEPPAKDLYVTFRKSISADPEENLKAIPRKQRAMVRKGIQAGLVGEIDTGVDRFFDMYSASVRNLGTPVLPKRWFATLAKVLGERCEVLTILGDGRPVSSVLSFYFRDEVLPYYGGGTDEARRFKANDFMYWDLMRRAAERGVRLFDYGRSKQGTGSYSFKKNWGFEPEPLHYEYHLVKARALPEINPLNPKYRLMVRTWQRLPLPISRVLGPMIARYLA